MHAPNVLMIGTGEYTTGFVHGEASRSDKSAGVVALTVFDLKQQGRIGQIFMAGTQGTKFPAIRRHLEEKIGNRYQGLKVSFESFPEDTVERDSQAYRGALDRMESGDVVIIFTPDDSHFPLAMEAVARGCHTLVAKPIVKTLADHLELAAKADAQEVLVAMEVHKRWDPIYLDARDRIRDLGEFSYFNAYMSQPKSQLESFWAWAGKSSDISYYLNAHHIDFNLWAVDGRARPRSVTACASTGAARRKGIDAEDTISLLTQWENLRDGSLATAIYTSSWIAPRSDVHSQQRFHFMGQLGEVQVDQAHRGYQLATDTSGLSSPNPLFMKYTPDRAGRFAGQSGYGYQSIADFIAAATSIRNRQSVPGDWKSRLATVHETIPVTAILEAGRRSLDADNRPVTIEWDSSGRPCGLSIR
jgi:D-galacturonate reductase